VRLPWAKQAFTKLAHQGAKFVTTDYVANETVSLLQARGLRYLATPWLDDLFKKKSLSVIWMNPDRFDEVRKFFAKHDDKEWSFTDCFSFYVMKERNIRQALTSDRHFSQAGFDVLLAH
jgi:predicted nucleic acid-binding protein